MKKAILTFALLISTLALFAQTTPQNNINVSGVHTYNLPAEYQAKMIVSMANVYYDLETINFFEIKSNYLDKLAKAGISRDQLKEDDLHYAIMGYDKEGTVLVFKTKSLDELQKFLSVKSMGVSKSETVFNAELSDELIATYHKAAFDNAKNKAEAIAQKIGRSIGKAISISDTNSNKFSESLYYGRAIGTKDYHISVSFELL